MSQSGLIEDHSCFISHLSKRNLQNNTQNLQLREQYSDYDFDIASIQAYNHPPSTIFYSS